MTSFPNIGLLLTVLFIKSFSACGILEFFFEVRANHQLLPEVDKHGEPRKERLNGEFSRLLCCPLGDGHDPGDCRANPFCDNVDCGGVVGVGKHRGVPLSVLDLQGLSPTYSVVLHKVAHGGLRLS